MTSHANSTGEYLRALFIEVQVTIVSTAKKLWRLHTTALDENPAYHGLVMALTEALLGRTTAAYRILAQLLIIAVTYGNHTGESSAWA